MTIGRPRDPSIPSDWRDCPVHGRAEHRRYTRGKGSSLVWACLECRHAYDSTHPRVPRSELLTLEPTEVDACPNCFIEKPVSGVCQECEE